MDRIIGKVARVTSDRELIINRGSADGVKPGMVFKVKGDEIEVPDPDTGESLGVVAPVKVFVEVAEVADKFSIARTFRERRVKIQDAVEGGAGYYATKGLGFQSMFQPPSPAKWEVQVETLRMDPSQGEPLPPSQSVVSVGDIVESVLDDEEVDQITTTLFK